MKTLLIKSTALVSLLGLAACGGGGGGGGSSTTTGGNVTEPVVSAPASTAAADLIAFVDEGGYAVANTHQNDSMTRMVRTGAMRQVRTFRSPSTKWRTDRWPHPVCR